MLAELYHRGPLSILMNAAELQFYRRGIHDPIFCDPSSLDHGQQSLSVVAVSTSLALQLFC